MPKDKIFLWGAGKIANAVAESLAPFILDYYDVLGFIDSNPAKHGKKIIDKMILPPNVLMGANYDYIVILADCEKEISDLAILAYMCDRTKIRNRNFLYQAAIKSRYKNTDAPDVNEVLNYISEHGLQIFNYPYTAKYKQMSVDAFMDPQCGLYYVVHRGTKKLYFNKNFKSAEAVKEYYLSLLCEQDDQSPHCYTTETFSVDRGDVVVDAGAAEGFFALEFIEKVKRVYLIEAKKDWIEALKQTFAPYQNKVVYVQKYLCDADYGDYASLDNVVNEPVNFIKMDIEGSEWDALRGAKRVIDSADKLKCACCCYHTDWDEYMLKKLFEDYGMNYSTSEGYMWFPYFTKNRLISDRLHRGIVRAQK